MSLGVGIAEAWPPNYAEVFIARSKRLAILTETPRLWNSAQEFYKTHPVEWIVDWCTTYDPRNAGQEGKLTRMPFILFKRQVEFVEFLQSMVKSQTNGLIEKSRDMGATWLCGAFSVWLWLYQPGAAIGWGSRKEDLVDTLGDPDSIFEKMRMLIEHLPRQLWPVGFNPKAHMTYMKIINPQNGASITGESGDNIGRGGRKLIYFKDESAHYERPEKIEAALGDNTNVQIDISSVNGLGNVFHRKREGGVDWDVEVGAVKGKTNVFVMDWSDHPAKTHEWYEVRRQKAIDDGLMHVFAQEVDRDYSGAVEGVVIPAIWVKAAIDAHIKLGFDDSGPWGAGLDVADPEEGGDSNALALRKGSVLWSVDEWSARDVGVTTRKALSNVEGRGPVAMQYDCIGVGSGVKAEVNRLKEENLLPPSILFVPWNAGSPPQDPEGHVIRGDRKTPKNKDYYANLKAQAWWEVRRRFERTYRAINDPSFTWEPEQLISLSSKMPLLRKLEKELSQPVMEKSLNLKLKIQKKPDGTRSPNLADAVIMAYWPITKGQPMRISNEVLQRAGSYVG